MIRYEFSNGDRFSISDLGGWVDIVAAADISFEESTFVLQELRKLRQGNISHLSFLKAIGMPPGITCRVEEF